MRVFFMNNVLVSVCAKSKGVVFNLGLLFMQLCCFILGCYFMALIKILCISFVCADMLMAIAAASPSSRSERVYSNRRLHSHQLVAGFNPSETY